jgi:hypothetical protein
VTTKRSGPATTPARPNAEAPAKDYTDSGFSLGQQLHRRREAALGLPPLDDGRRDPDLEPPTRHRCCECSRDLRLRPFKRLRDGRLTCMRCWRERWAAR